MLPAEEPWVFSLSRSKRPARSNEMGRPERDAAFLGAVLPLSLVLSLLHRTSPVEEFGRAIGPIFSARRPVAARPAAKPPSWLFCSRRKALMLLGYSTVFDPDA